MRYHILWKILSNTLGCQGRRSCNLQVDLLCIELGNFVADYFRCVQVLSVVGILQDETDPMVSVMKVRQGAYVCNFKLTHAAHMLAMCRVHL